MGSEQDEVLSLSDKEFSGFSSFEPSEEELPDKGKGKRTKNLESVVVKPGPSKEKASKSKTSGKKKTSKRNARAEHMADHMADTLNNNDKVTLDISKLSENDIKKLREALGIQQPVTEEPDIPLGRLDNLPNLRVEVDSRDLSDCEFEEPMQHNVGASMIRALFEDSDGEMKEDMWTLPKLKAPQKGKAVAKSMADMLNMSCTSPCDVDSILPNYKVPENCERACPPPVNTEIWRVMDKRTQSADRGIVDVQNMLATGITPIMRLAELFKKEIKENSEAKDYVSHALIMLGQVQYMLSIKRRYMIRPSLKKKYHGLCSISMPVTTQLFGDDVAKDIKACDAQMSIGREPRFGLPRGRGNQRQVGRGTFTSQSSYGTNRYTPYPGRGQYRQSRGMTGYRIPKRTATATSVAPNEQR